LIFDPPVNRQLRFDAPDGRTGRILNSIDTPDAIRSRWSPDFPSSSASVLLLSREQIPVAISRAALAM
jgi:hypothetical protein